MYCIFTGWSALASRCSSSDFESGKGAGRLCPCHADFIHAGQGRAPVQGLYKSFQQVARPFGFGFHITVPQVADVSLQAQLCGGILCEIPEADALNTPGYGEMNLDIGSHNRFYEPWIE